MMCSYTLGQDIEPNVRISILGKGASFNFNKTISNKYLTMPVKNGEHTSERTKYYLITQCKESMFCVLHAARESAVNVVT